MSNGDQQYWDQYWEENKHKQTFFNSLVAWAREFYFAKAFAKFIAKNYDIKGKVVCEIGVGTGLTLSYLKKLGAARCVGLDYSPKAVALAKELNPECEYVLADAFDTKLPDKQYDLIYSLGVLEHYNREEQAKMLAEQKRLAKECVFIEVPFDVFYFRWLFAINKRLGRRTTFSDEELFTKKTFKELGLTGESKLMPSTFFLTIGHFEKV